MDEILDYIKSAKTSKKYLVTSLICVELVGIFALLWVLKIPLYQKFLQKPQNAYSLTQMQTQTRYLLAQNDFIHGKTTGSGKLIVLLSDGVQVEEKQKLRASSDGDYYYQIPDSVKPGVKLFTVADLDEANNLLSIKSYQLRIKSNDIFNFNNSSQTSEYPTISLQDIVPLRSLSEQTTIMPNIKTTAAPISE